MPTACLFRFFDPAHTGATALPRNAPPQAVPAFATWGALDQTQFLLGHVSIQTTERYLGCKQKLRYAVNDTLGIEQECVT
jgi:hypothetical protein